MFGLNLLLRNGSTWDPSNAEALMKYSVQKGYEMHLELGNGRISQHLIMMVIDLKLCYHDYIFGREIHVNISFTKLSSKMSSFWGKFRLLFSDQQSSQNQAQCVT